MAAGPTSANRVVVVAIDRSRQADQALDWFMKNVHRPNDHVILIHVPEGPTLKLAVTQHMPEGEIQKIIEIEKRENEEMASKFNSKLQQLSANGSYRVVYATNPGEGIVDVAKQEHAAMVVMGTRGMGTIRRTIMGSVSDYVVHHADMPVVICRHHKS